MARIIAVAQQKGGAGKTMLVAQLGVALAGTRQIGLLDIDPQNSLTTWARLRAANPKAQAELAVESVSGWRLSSALDALGRALSEYLVNIEPVQQLAVLKTGAGQAQLLALAIDRSRLPEVAGTLAGDDTILIIARDARSAQAVVKQLRDLAS